MNLKNIIIISSLCLSFSFCSSKNKKEKNTETYQPAEAAQQISVKINAKPLSQVTLALNEIKANGINKLGEVKLDQNGLGTIDSIFLREKVYALISVGQNQNIFLVLDSNSKIDLTITSLTPLKYTIKGSDASEALKAVTEINAEYGVKMKDMETQFASQPMDNQKKAQAEATLNVLAAEATQKMIEAGQKSKNIDAKVFMVELLKLEFTPEEEINMVKEINELNSDFVWHQVFVRNSTLRTKTAIGSPAPEINLNDTNGNAIKLSSLRGKLVMIDFWASWCGPCRKENPNVVRLYSKYKDKGFEIYAVSLDKDRQAWINAIKADNLTWMHVSDLKYWQSAGAKEYGVGSIPATFLIGKDGKILAKGLRGQELENKVAEILK